MNAFDFHAPGRVVFGWGRIAELGGIAASIGKRAFLVWGSRTLADSDTGRKIISDLESAGVKVVPLRLPPGEPDVAAIDGLAAQVRAEKPTRDDVMIGIGGGSGMDAAKALSGLALDPEAASIKDFLEGVGTGRKIAWPVLPTIAVPTTAGTGSEATFNAVISSHDPPFKKSFRDHRLMPKVALIDPQLACSAPKNVTAWAGMDALTQLVEALISRKATEESRRHASDGLLHFRDALRWVNRIQDHRDGRERLAYAALQSGLALANGGLGLVHGVASGLGALKETPHGLACAVMLPIAVSTNSSVGIPGIAGHWQEKVALAVGVKDVFDWPTPTFQEIRRKAIDGINALLAELDIPTRLSALGVTKADVPELVRLSQGSSLSGNPKPITEAELAALLESML
jgi:alcohol dehydrogenase class IV